MYPTLYHVAHRFIRPLETIPFANPWNNIRSSPLFNKPAIATKFTTKSSEVLLSAIRLKNAPCKFLHNVFSRSSFKLIPVVAATLWIVGSSSLDNLRDMSDAIISDRIQNNFSIIIKRRPPELPEDAPEEQSPQNQRPPTTATLQPRDQFVWSFSFTLYLLVVLALVGVTL